MVGHEHFNVTSGGTDTRGMASAVTVGQHSLRLHSAMNRALCLARILPPNVSSILFLRRCYARGTTRRVVNVLSANQEIEKLKERRITKDPKKDPYIPFVPEDPVQKNLHRLATQSVSPKDRSKPPNRKNKDVAEIKMETLQESSGQLG